MAEVTQRADTTLPIRVRYRDGEPIEVEYYHVAQGLIKFDMDGSTAVVDERWRKLRPKATAKPENIEASVRALPFVESIEGSVGKHGDGS